jgi:hypothetical protein
VRPGIGTGDQKTLTQTLLYRELQGIVVGNSV